VNGESRMVKDNHGTGELFGLRVSGDQPTAAVHLYASADSGQTWRLVSSAPASAAGCVGQCSMFPSKVLALTQDSTGKVHVLLGANDYSIGGTFREYYVGLKLNYNANSTVKSYNLESVIPLPDHKRSVNVLSDLRGDIKIIDVAGSEQLMYVMNVTTSQDIKVFIGRSTTLAPAATSDFVGLSGAAGDTKLVDSCTFTTPQGGSYCSVAPAFFSTHNMTTAFGQNRSNKDVYVFLGAIEADYGIANDPVNQPEETHLRYYRLTWNGSNGWTVNAPVVVATDNGSYMPLLFNVQSGGNYVWLMYLHPNNGITFGRVDAVGTYATVTNPVAAKNHNGWGVFAVAPDDSKIWSIWNISVVSGASPQTAQAYWNGTTWSIFNDVGVVTGDNSGMGGSCGWSNGVAAILFRGTLLRNNPPIPEAATIWGQ